ncbi:FHA domain-containing protein [Chitiniphilus purpureus]|uniref:FHA domain-containing protein n=1 Tax=Chitiniphilus purpureus TaxID=2981137 RepID=A0ABY6DP68_9NEIS|nr:FHA domain-containing protein [Chitiniphilus sp. CD1]UXY16180.1 FHA domain-containing protein [Chitiniphilus sp. CD1]
MAKILLCLDGNVIKEFRLTRERTTIGRRPTNDIQIENLAVSGQHAALDRIGADVFVEDLESTNGTLVNGKPVQRQLLRNGDEVTVGKYLLKYWQAAAPSDDFDKTMMIRSAAKPPAPPAPKAATATAAATAARPAPAVVRPPAGATGVLKVISGTNAGRELPLDKASTRVGKVGVQVALINRLPQGYMLAHAEGHRTPLVNGAEIGATVRPLRDEDLIEVMGVQMVFFLR